MSGDAADVAARQRIDRDLDTTFLVEAAAGTGKTTSLVSRAVAMIGSGADVGQLALVTFTDKAAGELRLRLRTRLELSKVGASDVARGRFARALGRLEEARVSTIHRFAGDLLRERPIEAGVDPQFSPSSAGETRALFEQAFGRWLERALIRPSPALKRALARRDASVDRLRSSALRLIEHRHLAAPWTRRPFDASAESAPLVNAVRGLAARSANPHSRRDRLFVALLPVRQLAEAIDRRTLLDEQLEAELVRLSRQRWDKYLGGGAFGKGVERPELLAELEALRAGLARFAQRASADLAVELRDDLAGVGLAFEQLKARRGVLDFDDLLIGTRDLLLREHALLAHYRSKISHFFVDEFQDTDPAQAAILLLLTSTDEQPSDPFRVQLAPGRLFVVGDPKQSIYRFRNADPETYEVVRERVIASGGEVLQLGVSFRSPPSILRFVNAAFAPCMTGDVASQQAHYVPLAAWRDEVDPEPSIIALPVPRPYGDRRLARYAIRDSYPGAVGAFVAWLIRDSGRTIRDPLTNLPVPIAARHIAILFRQFESYFRSCTQPFSEALAQHGVSHLVLGGKLVGDREESHALLGGLCAVEHADDPLVVYATLRGLLFGLSDDVLLEWIHRYGQLRPLQLPISAIPEQLQGVFEALLLLRELHRQRNARPPSQTLSGLLAGTRALVGFALSPSAEQAFLQLASVEQVATSHERSGGLSFRGFVDRLGAVESERAGASEDIADDDSGGVRLITVHRAKGLEFPVVILADPAEGAARDADKIVDVRRGLAALSLMGCAPWDLLEAEAIEKSRSRSEGVRIAYVAATRARDLLVLPVVGDEPAFPDDGWLAPLTATLQPTKPIELDGGAGDLVLNRPIDVERPRRAASAGTHATAGGDVLFFDPRGLGPAPRSALGVREVDLIGKGADAALVAEDQRTFDAFLLAREGNLARASQATYSMETVTHRSHGAGPDAPELPREPVTIHRTARALGRPFGKRFGTLVHNVLASVPLDADREVIHAVATSVGRLLGSSPLEPEAAAHAVLVALAHPLFEQAREAERNGRLRREIPVTLRLAERELVDGIVDLTFEIEGASLVIDYKTDDPDTILGEHLQAYEKQVTLYAMAIRAATGRPAQAALFFL